MIAVEWGTGQVVWVLVWLWMFVTWAGLATAAFLLIARANYLSGWGKALWTLCIIALPILGVVLFLIVNGGRLNPPRASDAVILDPPPGR